MGKEMLTLHSHSALERELRMPKDTVLIDAKFGRMFLDVPHVAYKHGGVNYLKVNTMAFVKRGGVFKNFSA